MLDSKIVRQGPRCSIRGFGSTAQAYDDQLKPATRRLKLKMIDLWLYWPQGSSWESQFKASTPMSKLEMLNVGRGLQGFAPLEALASRSKLSLSHRRV